MRLIYKHDNVAILHSAKNILEINGIEAFVKNEHSSTSGARFGISNMFMELWLNHDEDFEKANTILERDMNNQVDAKPWVCGNCKEENDGAFEVCWKCQHSNEESP